MQDVIQPPKLSSAFKCQRIKRFFNDANYPAVPSWILAQETRVSLGDVEARRAEYDAFLEFENRLSKRQRLLPRSAEQVIREPRGGFWTDPWQATEFIDQPGHRLGGEF